MSENRRFECATGDGTTLTVVQVVPGGRADDGVVWLGMGPGDDDDPVMLVSRDNARAMGRRLLEIAGEEGRDGG